jgi:hypothetical protein
MGKIKKLCQFVTAHRKTVRTMMWLIVVGVIVTAFTIMLEKLFHKPPGSGAELAWWQAIIVSVTDHVGLGLFAAAILGIVIELPHMHEYFQERIQNTIISRSFINQLSPMEQERLQEQALEAFFGVEELGEEGGFYKFYREKIRRHIGDPYRKDTTFQVVIERAGNDSFKVSETISFTCKKAGDAILPDVRWTTELDEINEILELDFTAKKAEENNSASYCFNAKNNQCHGSLQPYATGHGYVLPLGDYASCDGLSITLKVIYIAPSERPFAWGMPCLSDGFSGEIHFPADLEIFADLFGMDEKALPQDRKNLPRDAMGLNICTVSHKNWLLPDDGFSFHFRQKRVPAAPPAPPPAPAPAEA